MKKLLYSLLILILAGAALYFFLAKNETGTPKTPESVSDGYVPYKSSEYSPEFVYPASWGAVTILEGNKVCPDDDTYRTADTLIVFDWEFSFSEIKLPGSESFIRAGIRTRELDPDNLSRCEDDLLLQIARKEIIPETLSSVMLRSVTNPNGLMGIFNPEASRLNTESRTQYTFFVPEGTGFYVLQPYISFIPYYGSPELEEMEGKFSGDMGRYLKEGTTSGNIRTHLEYFRKMAESLKFRGE